jgi:hypothetical protein
VCGCVYVVCLCVGVCGGVWVCVVCVCVYEGEVRESKDSET